MASYFSPVVCALAAVAGAVFAGCLSPADMATVEIVVQDLPPGARDVAYEGQVEFRAGSYTALDQLRELGERHDFVVNSTYHESFDATLVEAIDGLANQPGPNSTYYFWQFEVDGQPSMVGADKVMLQDGQAVTWRFVLG